MKVKFEKFSNGELNIPLIYFFVFTFLFIAGFIYIKMGFFPPMKCEFKEITGYPCPTCGSTRLFISIYNLNIVQALKYNPFVFVSGTLLYLWSLTGFIPIFFKKKLSFKITDKEKKITIISIAILFLINWIYLISNGI